MLDTPINLLLTLSRQVQVGGSLTFSQIHLACRNVGINLDCGGCACEFYTGTSAPHDNECTRQSYWYLATPYALYSEGLEAVYEEARMNTSLLISNGITVYSPILHNHNIRNVYSGNDPFEFWVINYRIMLQNSCGLIVCMMDGWERSKGVTYEIDLAKKLGLSIVPMKPREIPSIPFPTRSRSYD